MAFGGGFPSPRPLARSRRRVVPFRPPRALDTFPGARARPACSPPSSSLFPSRRPAQRRRQSNNSPPFRPVLRGNRNLFHHSRPPSCVSPSLFPAPLRARSSWRLRQFRGWGSTPRSPQRQRPLFCVLRALGGKRPSSPARRQKRVRPDHATTTALALPTPHLPSKESRGPNAALAAMLEAAPGELRWPLAFHRQPESTAAANRSDP